jgi:hypothetical protein
MAICIRGHDKGEERRCTMCRQNCTRRFAEKTKAKNRARRELRLQEWTPEVSEMDLAWAAGIFEGEGTVTLNSMGSKPYTRLVACLTSTDKEIALFFSERWAGKLYLVDMVKRGMLNAKDAWCWRQECAKGAIFLAQILPFVRTRRVREKIALALHAQAARQPGPSKDPAGYRAMHHKFRERMKVLNHRGRTIPDGRTVGEWAKPQLEAAYRSGNQPAQLYSGDSR